MVETAALVCGHVFRNERNVKLVVRHSDGGWQLACGDYDHPDDASDSKVVGLNHLYQRTLRLTCPATWTCMWR